MCCSDNAGKLRFNNLTSFMLHKMVFWGITRTSLRIMNNKLWFFIDQFLFRFGRGLNVNQPLVNSYVNKYKIVEEAHKKTDR